MFQNDLLLCIAPTKVRGKDDDSPPPPTPPGRTTCISDAKAKAEKLGFGWLLGCRKGYRWSSIHDIHLLKGSGKCLLNSFCLVISNLLIVWGGGGGVAVQQSCQRAAAGWGITGDTRPAC